jgi:predicted DNA-binding protein (MmcQ/YjbR family)
MNFTDVEHYLAQKPEAELCYPFDPNVPVYKIKGKMFALMSEIGSQKPNKQPQVNLKCDPLEAQQLRDIFTAVIPGYHMNKKHWNTVVLDQSIPDGEMKRMIDESYRLVVKGLKKAERNALETAYSAFELYGDKPETLS